MPLVGGMAACVPSWRRMSAACARTKLVNDGEAAQALVPSSECPYIGDNGGILELLVDRSRAKRLASVAFDRARLVFSPTKYNDRILNIYDTLLCHASHIEQSQFSGQCSILKVERWCPLSLQQMLAACIHVGQYSLKNAVHIVPSRRTERVFSKMRLRFS